jgi:hypothetical protein
MVTVVEEVLADVVVERRQQAGDVRRSRSKWFRIPARTSRIGRPTTR